MNLLLVLLFGLTILIGTIIVLITNKKWIQELSLGIAFSVITLLVIFELVPETLEHCSFIVMVVFTLIGMVFIKLLDLFVPEHHHSSDSGHTLHIGIITCIALILHNLIEGMTLYIAFSSSIKLGLLMGLGVGLHNIPMGMVIGSTLYEKNNSLFKTLAVSFLVSLSTFFGGLIVTLFGSLDEYILGILLSLTLGMLLYMVLFELLHHLKHQNKKNSLIGIIIGVIIFLLSLLIHSH